MYGIRRITYFSALLLVNTLVGANENTIVKHVDPIEIKHDLSLSDLIDLTLKKYPDQRLNQALIKEVDALRRRGSQWLSAAPSVSFRYQDDLLADNTGLRELETELGLSLWNWGQRSAGLALADKANATIDKQQQALRLKVAGLIRLALWDMSLEDIRYQQAKITLEISEKLLDKIKHRVELGDLAEFDLLLAQSDHLEKRTLFVQAQAEMMHARERYFTLTQSNQVPANYTETQSTLDTVEHHPALQVMNTLIEREKANLNWVESKGSGQPLITLGGKSERGSRANDDIESLSLTISIPFGGAAYLAPKIASVNIKLTKIITRREHLYRKLTADLHEINHQLEVNRAELMMANELKQISNKHLKMAQFGFSEGEINLMDLLKIQTKNTNALRHAKEHKVMLQRNIALYNQIVGVQP
ncbi:MAG: TolC family protein [Methylococcales bacterium]|nr:TolC family protein [Methylococcales bacterium]